MMRYVSIGSIERPKVEPLMPRPKGRPKATPAEGGLSLGDKRPSALASKKAFEEEQARKEIHRRLELPEHVHSQGPVDERMEKILSLHAQSLHENEQLMGSLAEAKLKLKQ